VLSVAGNQGAGERQETGVPVQHPTVIIAGIARDRAVDNGHGAIGVQYTAATIIVRAKAIAGNSAVDDSCMAEKILVKSTSFCKPA